MNPGMKIGPFTIEDEIGSGAKGAVYRAQYRDKKLRVAIKVMAPNVGSSPTAQARFQRVSEILKQLQICRGNHISNRRANPHMKQLVFVPLQIQEALSAEGPEDLA